MTIKLRMLVVKPDTKYSNIFIGGMDKPMTLRYGLHQKIMTLGPKNGTSGLCHVIENMFEHLADVGVYEIIAHSDISNSNSSSISDISKINPFIFLCRHGWLEVNCLPTEIFKEIQNVITLITWTQSERFSNHAGGEIRNCVICNNTQHGKWTGQIVGGFISDASTAHGTRKVYSFPKNCTNPVCLSHKIEKAINPSYKTPE